MTIFLLTVVSKRWFKDHITVYCEGKDGQDRHIDFHFNVGHAEGNSPDYDVGNILVFERAKVIPWAESELPF